MGKAFRFQDTLYDKPLLATSATVESVFKYLNSRNSGEFELSSSKTSFSSTTSEVEFDSLTKIGKIRIDGPLTYRSTILTALCGLTSYQKLESDFRKLLSLEVKTVVLWIDSGGGEAYSAFETASLIRSLADKHGVKLIGYCDGIAASAAYAFASVCHEFVMNPEAQAGSVGVVVKLRNNSKQLQSAGINDTFLYAGDNKVPFDKSGEWSASFIDDIQSKVDQLYAEFTGFVAKNRKLNVTDIVATKAKMFSANDAVKLGLADSAMTREQFSKFLVSGTKPVQKSTVRAVAKPKSTTSLMTPVKSHTNKSDGVRTYLEKIYGTQKQ